MENPSDNSDEETLAIAAKTSNKAIESAVKTGYKEGVQDGSESVFQEGFDRGYKQAFPTILKLGIYRGIANCLLKGVKHPDEIENILSNVKEGICYVCKTKKDNSQVTIDELETCQKEHEDTILKTLQDYFDPLFKEHNFVFNI